MYYIVNKSSKQSLFSHHDQALHLLLGIKTFCDRYRIQILDYLLVPHQLQLLIKASDSSATQLASYLALKPIKITPSKLLLYFKKLGCMGIGYTFCGSFELYHSSWCFCELGKAGANGLPFPLQTVIQIKNQQRDGK